MSPASPEDRDQWVTARYGKTPDQLRAAAIREHANGNPLVAYCLWQAADGRIPPHPSDRHGRTARIVAGAIVVAAALLLVWAS